MAERRRWTELAHVRSLPLLLSVVLLSGLLAVVDPVRAFAAGTVLFQNAFINRTVDGTGTVTTPTSPSGTNAACLTASGNTSTGPLTSCTSSTDTQGSGKLRLTRGVANQIGAVYGATSFPTSSGLDVTFNTYQYGGTGADGMSFVLAAVDPANPVAPTAVGQGGGSLGYSPYGGIAGLPNGYLGVGLDVYGNYSAPSWQGSGCTSATNINAAAAGAVVVRGPGNGTTGYCGLSTSYTGSSTSRVTLRASSRAASVVPVEVLVNPGTTAFTADSGVSVSAGTYKVVFTPVGGTQRTLTGTLPTVPASLYSSSSYVNANGYPKQLAFGFIGSTGGSYDFHEASDVKVVTFNAVAQLAVSSTSYVAASPAAGDPVNYVVTPSVQSGVDVNRAITMTQTVPAGVTPAGAYGTGWTCADPSGQTITCTSTATSFTNGTTLSPINVVGIVTGSSVTASTVQNGSTSAVSSENANPATATTTTAGTRPTAPSGISLSPASGSTSGGGTVTISGSNLTAATAIEIGTTAEQQAGTPVVLLPCSTTITTSCFRVSGSTLVVSSWPARAAPATVGVRVVTLGVQGSATYTYASRPGTPAAPTATAGPTSATVSWTAPDTNGAAISGYVVTPYLGGVAQTPVSYDASSTTRTLTGLTAGGSYTFTVAAVNTYGTSTASSASSAVVPYTVPGAPTVTAASAGDSSATLTWTAPSSNGFSPITGYVVTPYVGTVAQTPVTFSGTATTQTVTGLTPGTAYTFRVAAVNAAGTGPASGASAAVSPNASPSLTFAAPPAGEVGVAYSRQLTVNDGTAPYTWSVSSGSLPAGLTLSASTGLLSGTPTAAGSSSFTVQVTDASGQSATRAVTLVVAARPTITFSPAAGEVSVGYSQTPTVTGGTGPFSWALTAGSLPAGVTLDATTGALSGTPTAAGTFSATLTVTDAFNQTASRTVSVVIAALPTLGFANTSTPQVGVAYSNSLPVSGGTGPFTWSLAAGSLPAGLSLNASTGAVAGTPTTAGSFSATITVTDSFGQTASRTFAGTVAAGPLVVTKTASASSTVAGGTVAYTVTVQNTGSSTFSDVTLNDPLAGVLDDATYNGNASASVGTLGYTGGTLTWTGTLAAGTTATITYSVAVANPVTGNQVLTNTVSSPTLGTNCASGSADSRCTATVTVAGLSITKTAGVASTTPGSTVRFTVVVTNSGRTAYVGATFTDNLADVLDDAGYDGNATATTGSLSFTSPALTWTGNLAVGARATITYTVTVGNPEPGNRSLSGTVVSPTAGSVCPSGNPAASCTATVPVLVPALSITDTAAVASTTPGSRVAHTVTIANTGQTAYAATSVAVALAGALDDATYNGDAAAGPGSVGYAAGSGTLTWTGDLAVGAVVTLTFSVTVSNPDAGDRTLTTVASSAAAGSTCPAGGTGTACTSRVSVLVPALSIAKTSDVSYATPGSVVRYTVLVANTGQTAYTGAAFTDPLAAVLDDATVNNDVGATSGTAGFNGSAVSWTGDLAVGASATITYSVRVRDPDPGNRSLTSTITSSTPFATCASGGADARCTSTVPVLLPGLELRVSTDVASTIPGGIVRYSFTATNTGQTSYTGVAVQIDLSNALDDAGSNNDYSVTTGSLTRGAVLGTTTWTLDLAPGASASGTGSLLVRDPDPGDRSLVGTLTSSAAGSTCPTPTAGNGCRSTVPVLLPGLSITKTASSTTVQPGGQVGYTITVTNTGETVQGAASLTDPLARVLTDATYDQNATATAGTVSYASGTLAWSGRLAVGASATISYSVTVRDPDPGDKQLVNTVVSDTPGSSCPSGGGNARCTAVVSVLVPQLTLTKSADRATTAPDQTVTYTVTVTNSGSVAYAGASFTDPLADVLDDAELSGAPTTTAGSVVASSQQVSWTGDLAVGASATISYAVRVNAADVGNDLLTNVLGSTTRGSNCAAGSTDSRCGVTVPVARLVLSEGFEASTATPGSVVRSSALFVNTGQVAYTNITVNLSSTGSAYSLSNGDQTVSSGTLVVNPPSAYWTGSIPVGGTVTGAGTFTVKNDAPADAVLTTSVTSDAPGNNCPVGGSDPRCGGSVRIVVPQLTVRKTADASFVTPRGTVGYTITIANTGQTPYTGATVTDSLAGVLDDASYDGNAVATRGTVGYAEPTLTWTGDLAVGDSVTLSYTMTANDPGNGGDKVMVNVVSSGATGSTCPPASGNAACRTRVAVLTPGITLSKTADVPYVAYGDVVVYTVTVTNTGQTTYPAASFTDPLNDVSDNASYNGDATATSGSVGYAAPVLSWSGRLAPGDAASVSYSVTVNNPATGPRLRNAVVSGDPGTNCAAGSVDARCTAVISIVSAVTLTWTKQADAVYTTPGATVGYTLTATNSSARDVSARVRDPLADVLDDATYNNDGAAGTGSVTFDGSILRWSGTVPAGATVTIRYSVRVNAAITGNQVLAGQLVSGLPSTSNNCLSGSTDARCSTAVPVARLRITQSYAETSTTPGSLIHLTATFTNTGQYPYAGITVSSPTAGSTDDANPTGDQTASSGTLVLTSTAITWTGRIEVGQTVTIRGTLTVKNPDTADHRITGTLVSDAPGNNCTDGSGDPLCTARLTVLEPRLTLSKTASTSYVVPGGRAGYTVTVTNTGQTPYTGATVTDTLVGVLDDAAYNGDAAATAGTVGYSAPTLTWTGDLAVGASTTITYSVTAGASATGDKVMANPVLSTDPGSTCPPASGNAGCRATVLVLTPALTLSSTASRTTALPGDTVGYTVTVLNSGQTPYPAATFDVPLTGLLDDATLDDSSITASSGSAGRTGATLTWTGSLAPGARATVTFAVTVAAPVTGDSSLTQSVVSGVQGSTCPAASGNPACSSTVGIAGLRITNSADVANAQPRDVVTFTGVFTNTGTVPYYGITVDDSFVGTGDDAVYGGDATATAGSLVAVPGSGIISWTGDLPVGASVTVTGTVTVRDPDRADHRLVTVLSTRAAGSNCPVDGTDPVCRTAVPVLEPALSIRTATDTTAVGPGGRIVYTLTIADTGETDYAGVEVDRALGGVFDEATYNGDGEATRGDVVLDGRTLRWVGDVGRGETVTVRFSVTVHTPYFGDSLLISTVSSDAVGSSCPRGSSSPACVSTVSVLVPRFDTTITADQTTTTPGGTVGYTVTMSNTGQTDADGAVLDVLLAGVLDDAVYAGDAVASSGSVAYAAPRLTWTGDLPVGASATVTFSATVARPPTGDRSLVATLDTHVPGSGCSTGPGGEGPDGPGGPGGDGPGDSPQPGNGEGCTSTVAVLLPGLAVRTAASVASATPGDPVRFTFTVTNTGETPYPGATTTVALADVLDDADLVADPTASTGSVTVGANGLTWTGALPLGGAATISVAVAVRPADRLGDHRLGVSAVSDDVGSSCPAGGDDPGCTAVVAVLVPHLAVRTTGDPASTTPGSVVAYTTTITNDGETTQTDVTVRTSLMGLLAEAAYNRDATVTGGGVLDYAAPLLRWTGTLPVGASATVTFSVTVNNPATGDRELSTSTTSSAPGSSCSAGSAAGCATAVQVLVPALQITKTASTATVVAGSAVQYTITVVNTGQTPYAPATVRDDLAGVLDDARYPGDATATSGTVDDANGTLVWSGPLGVGASATITFSVVSTFPAAGDHTLRNTVVSSSPGANCVAGTTRTRCRSEVSVLVPALTISKVASATSLVAGGTLGYTLTATNTGQADYPNATLTDTLADVLDDATLTGAAAATGGTVGVADGVLTWSGPLPRGASVVITYSVTVAPRDLGNRRLVNTVASTTVGSTCPTTAAPAACTTLTTVESSVLTVSDLAASFRLTGPPGSTVQRDGAVTLTVTTNSFGGYAVGVRATEDRLHAAGTTDTIPIGQLGVRPDDSAPFSPLSPDQTLPLHSQDRASATNGDAVGSDYQVQIPFVDSGEYGTTVEYIVTAQ